MEGGRRPWSGEPAAGLCPRRSRAERRGGARCRRRSGGGWGMLSPAAGPGEAGRGGVCVLRGVSQRGTSPGVNGFLLCCGRPAGRLPRLGGGEGTREPERRRPFPSSPPLRSSPQVWRVTKIREKLSETARRGRRGPAPAGMAAGALPPLTTLTAPGGRGGTTSANKVRALPCRARPGPARPGTALLPAPRRHMGRRGRGRAAAGAPPAEAGRWVAAGGRKAGGEGGEGGGRREHEVPLRPPVCAAGGSSCPGGTGRGQGAAGAPRRPEKKGERGKEGGDGKGRENATRGSRSGAGGRRIIGASPRRVPSLRWRGAGAGGRRCRRRAHGVGAGALPSSRSLPPRSGPF